MRAALLIYFVAGSVFLLLRHAVLPEVNRWREPIAAQASAAVGLPVTIGRVEADWSGFRPRFHLRQVRVADAAGATGLTLDRVDATLAWSSLFKLRPYFHRLEIFQPALQVARDGDGRITVAGIEMRHEGDDAGALEWLLAQRQFVIRDASLTWSDALRAAPPLVLSEVNLRVTRFFGRHRMGLTARPAPTADRPLLGAIDVRADVSLGERARVADVVGRVYARLTQASIAAAAPWLDLPGELDGAGDVSVWAEVIGGQVVKVSADLDVTGAQYRFADDLPVLKLKRVSGYLSGSRVSEGIAVHSRGLTLETDAGVRVAPTDAQATFATEGVQRTGQFRANQLDLAALATLAAHLPLDAAERKRLAALSPRGALSDVEAGWRSDGERLLQWSVRADFADIGLNPRFGLPGLRGISGHVAGDQSAGRYALHSDGVAVEIPSVFTDALAFDRLAVDGGWQRETGGVRVLLDSATFANQDLRGDAAGNYMLTPTGPGEIDLQARLEEAEGTAVWRYLPKVVGAHTRNWLKRGIVAARAHDARLRLKGALADFPYREGNGIFLITFQVSDATLDFAPSWPNIDSIEGGVRFEGPGMTITGSRGVISGVDLRDVVADVPDLDTGDEHMTITGRALGTTANFLRFVGDSPVRARINGFTDDMRAEGDGQLDLKLVMPLRHVVDTDVSGAYRFAGNTLTVVPALPPITNAAGQIAFTADSLTIKQAGGEALGGPVRLSARTDKDGIVRFDANGEADAQAIQGRYDVPLLAHLSGRTPWQAEAIMRKGGTEVNIGSTLEGLASSLPAPFNKSSTQPMPLTVGLRFDAGAPVRVDGALGNAAKAVLSVPRGDNAVSAISGGVGIGVKPRVAQSGVMVAWKQPTIDLDGWLRALGSATARDTPAVPLAGVALETDTLKLKQQRLHAVSVRAKRSATGWQAEVRSKEAEGTLSWTPDEGGRVVARLSRLMLGKAAEGEAPAPAGEAAKSLPALDVVAERFGVRGLDLGRLQVQAFNREGVWHMNDLTITSPVSTFKGSGTWQPAASGRTEMRFELNTKDIGKLLTRLAYPDAVRGGTAKLSGTLGWDGGPADLDYPSMNGMLELEARSGQFRKLNPGVGRLLGVLSLQSLPRRITLDFRDVFSEGFAFDRISGSIDVNKGVLHTDPLEIRGPAARVFMRGEASVPDETQNLRVTVQPTLSESVAVGAALGGAVVNPVAGVVTYIVQKVLEDPVEKFFAFEYAVTGTWDDPVVEKKGRRPPPAPKDAPAIAVPEVEKR